MVAYGYRVIQFRRSPIFDTRRLKGNGAIHKAKTSDPAGRVRILGHRRHSGDGTENY
jgi:hypothetical protein